ncbi:metal-dependent transcriptional regulator [Clostridium sp. Marseille-P299]|uniref:metal-dependent transcriptional regulator n=1 Tax=Clostridium sp. Marseille-P299 TaxID=1805477 RepID=UPI00082A3861|nr:metal-dependent transcriptional regulator [Clostridium sp. Marseille-P299]
MTQSKEDYLKIIYEADLRNEEVNNKYIMKELGVSAASVSEMLKKLEKEGYVEYIPYHNIVITKKGIKEAASLVRKHKLWEVFLMQHLGYTWSEVHEEAEQLEHVTSDKMIERLDQFLNYPEVCPHGGKIPRDNDEEYTTKLFPLSTCMVGQTCKIMGVPEDKEILDYLYQVGISIGDEYVIKEIGPFEGMFTLVNDERNVQLSYKIATELYVI